MSQKARLRHFNIHITVPKTDLSQDQLDTIVHALYDVAKMKDFISLKKGGDWDETLVKDCCAIVSKNGDHVQHELKYRTYAPLEANRENIIHTFCEQFNVPRESVKIKTSHLTK